VPPGEYQDPDLIFDPPVFGDDLERSLAQDTVMAMKTAPFMAVEPQTPVEEMMREMVKLDVACAVVLENKKLLGVISERDILTRVAGHYEKVRGRPVREVMTRDPVFVHTTDSPALALNLMAVGGFRHVPIVDVDGHVVGIIGPRRILNYLEPHIKALRPA
jgi:CBS domain-containing protein